ncbi:helix-turn-helix domain-containing protein, partial [Citrobacter amalonaticus]|uniref:helix-turn-helix domain-containing protein n=1 Tax=Citrobacter amalonaticus TaxID=35703 RepID=UPI002406FF11
MRRTFTAEEKASVFELWKNGTGFSEIANILGSKPGTIFTMLRDTGGIKPHECQQRVKSDPLTATTNGLILIHLVYSGLASA